MVVAAKCVPVPSSWVKQFILTCDNLLAVEFKNGVCCLYPASSKALFEIAITWPSPGKFVHVFLYKKLAYKLIKCPCPAQPCDGHTGTITTTCCPNDLVPATLHATFTNAGPLDGSYALSNDPTNPEPTWQTGNVFDCLGIPQPLVFACTAVATAWVIAIGIHGYGTSAGSSCSPFVQRFTGVDLTGCGGPTGATITVTT